MACDQHTLAMLLEAMLLLRQSYETEMGQPTTTEDRMSELGNDHLLLELLIANVQDGTLRPQLLRGTARGLALEAANLLQRTRGESALHEILSSAYRSDG